MFYFIFLLWEETDWRHPPSIISTAATGVCFKILTASVARIRLGNTINELALNGSSSTVRIVTLLIKAKVPSLPTIKWVKI